MATSFTSSANRHGGQESTLLALNNTFYHWGSLIVPPGDTNPVLYEAGGNPYGTSYPSGLESDSSVSVEALTAAHYQGYRLAQYAARLVAGGGGRRDDGAYDPLALDPYDPPQRSIFAGQAQTASP